MTQRIADRLGVCVRIYISWTAYGVVVAHDPMMYVPNGFGLLAGLAQLALFARFGVGSRESPEESLVASKMV